VEAKVFSDTLAVTLTEKEAKTLGFPLSELDGKALVASDKLGDVEAIVLVATKSDTLVKAKAEKLGNTWVI